MVNTPDAATGRGERVACADCGLVQYLPPAARGTLAECRRCHHSFGGTARGSLDTALAASAAALLLLLPATLLPLMSVTALGARRRGWLSTGVESLWNDGFISLAAIVGVFSLVIPFLYLGLMIWTLSHARYLAAQPRTGAPGPAARAPFLGRLFGWTIRLRSWVMVEVYVVGCCVAYTRLQAIGTVDVSAGGWCLLAATFALLFAAAHLDEHALWKLLPSHPPPRRVPAAQRHRTLDATPASSRGPASYAPPQALSCSTCELLLDAAHEHQPCPRCGTHLRRRKRDAKARTLALVLCGFLLYLPANILPVLSIERLGREQPSTILGGVRELIASGLWPLAVVVFTASIVVPLLKLLGLSFMLLLTHRHSARWLVGRTRLYRFIDFIGRWSNIDLFMISVLVALVQYGTLTSVRAQPGAIAFATVVVITMVASRCFDARVMWDAAPTRTPDAAVPAATAGAAA